MDNAQKRMDNAQKRFETMVHALSSDLYRYAYLLCRHKAMAEDLVQETFLRAWRHLGSLRDESKAKSWLITTLRREFARQFERYQPHFDDIDIDRIAEPDSVEKNADVWLVRRALLELPAKYRDALGLQVIGGYSGAEIAEIVDLPLPTVNTRLFRARQQLRKVLESRDDNLRHTATS